LGTQQIVSYPSTLVRKGPLLIILNEILISSGNSLTAIPRLKFCQVSWNPWAYSSWHKKLTIWDVAKVARTKFDWTKIKQSIGAQVYRLWDSFFIFLVGLGFERRVRTCKAGAPWCKLYLQSILLCLIWIWGPLFSWADLKPYPPHFNLWSS
jgi:hypothetical protein